MNPLTKLPEPLASMPPAGRNAPLAALHRADPWLLFLRMLWILPAPLLAGACYHYSRAWWGADLLKTMPFLMLFWCAAMSEFCHNWLYLPRLKKVLTTQAGRVCPENPAP